MSKHAPEPWTMDTHRLSLDAFRLAGGIGPTWLLCEYDYTHARACVNACAGIADPPDLRKQRDKLLAACEAMVLEFDIAHMESAFDGQVDSWNNARATIAAAKAEEG